MPRTHYENGDEITLSCGCDGCNPCMINGVLCHETGCDHAWRDYAVACFECGCPFYPTEGPHENVCPDCLEFIDLAASWGEEEEDDDDGDREAEDET